MEWKGKDTFEKILVPLDGSELAEAILPALKPLVRRVGAEVILVQIAPYPAVPGPTAYVPVVEFEEPAREYIRRTVAGVSKEGIRARYACRLARVELRHEPSRAARYGYALLRRGVLAPKR